MINKLANKRFLFSVMLALGLALAGRATAFAASPRGVTVSPAFQQVSILPGEDQHEVSFTITNDESKPQSFDLSAADFNTLGESGGLFFVGTNPTALQQKYGLAKWFELPQNSLTLAPGQSQTLKAEILNLPDLAPGGHYGALLLAAGGSGASGNAANNVTIHPIASSLLFVTKVGGDTHQLELSQVSSNRSLLELPSHVTLRFHNTGNTHVTPRGVVKLTTAGGKLISQGVINEDSNIILPQTYRQINVPLNKFAGGSALGKYTLKVDFRLDGFNTYREYRTTFDYIAPGLVAGAALVIVCVFILIYRKYEYRK